MKYAIVSDLHLCGGAANNTGWKDQELVSALKALYTEVDVVVLAGDVFECWQSQWLLQRQALADAVLAYPLTWSFMVGQAIADKLIYVVGNHDYIVYRDRLFPGIVKHFDVVSNHPVEGVILHIEHGHGGDALNSRIGWVGRAIAYAVGWLERLGWRDAEADLQRLEKYAPGRSQDEDVYRDHALSIIHNNAKTWAVVMGHTHRPYCTELVQTRVGDGVLSHFYYNCGQFRPESCSGVIVDTDTGTISGMVMGRDK